MGCLKVADHYIRSTEGENQNKEKKELFLQIRPGFSRTCNSNNSMGVHVNCCR
jgi:hypothetical protein